MDDRSISHITYPLFLPSICIDSNLGIFFVAQSRSGQLAPIHVQKHILKQFIYCTDKDCQSLFEAATDSKCPGLQCLHLDSVCQALPGAVKDLDISFLTQLSQANVISKVTVCAVERLLSSSHEANCPLVVHTDFVLLGYSGRMNYYSVYTGEETYYSKLKRVRVTFDCDTAEWFCQCSSSGRNKVCLHQAVAKWFVAQHQQHFLGALESQSEESILTDDMKFQMEYLMKHKLIPSSMPPHLCVEKPPNKVLEPSETSCPRCHGTLNIFRESKGSVYGIGVVWRDIKVITKRCSLCNNEVRFQDFESGFHNFNSTVLLTLKLCSTLISGIQNHVSIEGCLKTLFHNNLTIPINCLRNRVLHFMALQDIKHDFVCLQCGVNPKIVIADGNWRNTCRRPGPSKNPWKVEIHYGNIAPWIGKKTRVSENVHNTEHRKGSVLEAQESERIPVKNCPVTQDDILMALNSPKANTQDLRDLCSTLGISGDGSTDDLINRLNELVLFKDVFPKFYSCVKNCGGGILHIRCTHGVCVYMKYILRQESARDYIDAILAFREQPRVIISDIASQVAHHGEARVNGLFRPNKGMLYPYTEENVKLHTSGSLQPVMLNLKETKDTFYSLNDRFHHRSKKNSVEKSFRDLNYCADLRDINSSVAEQQNAKMSHDRYSVCSMKPVNFLFVSRTAISLSNDLINERYVAKIKKRVCPPRLSFDKEGRVIPDLKDRFGRSTLVVLLLPSGV